MTKLPYTSPRLTVHGSVATLTQITPYLTKDVRK